MTVQEQYVAFPRLMGAPAYARPPRTIEPAERPFDPDALPLAVEQTPDERVVAGIDGSGSASFAGARRSPIAVMSSPTAAAAHGGYLPPDTARGRAGALDHDTPGDGDRTTAGESPGPLEFALRGFTARLRSRR